eukprot:TRINITY_DN8974_c0_g1_i1.p1 TRINITY_DN8974_c0_g1~~TRINITY_DN8974_c0_g1_i1.p1  ORF type:complete len:206 (+),score=29.00 TRINITY_DN8974_c0_g1_i1:540-1157(+)
MARSAIRQESVDHQRAPERMWQVSGSAAWGAIELRLEGSKATSPDASLLQAAIERNFSSDGEMFDIHHLAVIAAEVCGLNAIVVGSSTVKSDSGEDFGEAVAGWILQGGVAIVPYDKEDANHMPCLKAGHSAHYALVCGVARDLDAPNLRLIAVHGMSRRPLVLTSNELEASNAQLHELKPTVNTKKWVLGSTGMRLAGRILCLG